MNESNPRHDAPGPQISAETVAKSTGLAAGAGLLACVVCCSLPPLALALGSAGLGGIAAKFVSNGSELIVGGVAFVGALSFLMWRGRTKAASPKVGASTCQVDSGCGTEKSAGKGCCG